MKNNSTILRKVRNVNIIPVSLKIVIVFALFIFISNLTTNYIGLSFNRVHQISFAKQLLIKDLKEISNFCNIQWQILQLNNDEKGIIENIHRKIQFELKNKSSIILGIKTDGTTLFSSLSQKNTRLDTASLSIMKEHLKNGREEDFIIPTINGLEYFGIYKYNKNWDMFLFRGEEYKAFFEESWDSFERIILIIVLISIASIITGIFVVRYILRFIGIITDAIKNMVEKQQLAVIPLHKAPNDDVTYMGMAFNSLSNNIDNLIKIFKKFTDRDIVARAYEEKSIKLDGEQKELAILFSDIKGYTNMTETLGADIIKLINIQYDQAINQIYQHNGIIASIIGDALLAVYGVMPSNNNKSYEALLSGYQLLQVTEALQQSMQQKKQEIEDKNGQLTAQEEKIYQAVMLEIGVGIDGGRVFYGTIGSHLRMTSTVIGDRVNAASRLEGLTRIYKVPMICSIYIRNDIVEHIEDPGFTFINIDKVQVKGKTEGIPIFWPIPNEQLNQDLEKQLTLFQKALEFYYQGDWSQANKLFEQCNLDVADEFKSRTAGTCPSDWKGIWVLTTK